MKEDITKRFVQSYYKLVGLEAVKTKKDFCHTVHCAQSNFKCMEDGARGATVDNLYLLNKHYFVNLDWLFTGRGEFLVNRFHVVGDFTKANIRSLERYALNKDFDPEYLTDENLQKCVDYIIDKHQKKR